MNTRSYQLINFSGICCVVTAIAWSIACGDEAAPQVSADIDQRLLDGLEEPAARPAERRADIAGEDLGAAKPESTLASLAELMQGVERRLRQKDTSAATTQLQSDIAAELAKLLDSAEQASASRATGAASNRPSEESSRADAKSTSGDRQEREAEGSGDQLDPLDAVWGALPQRLRQQIENPLQEEFLPRYERVIKQYYKRLAEEQRRLREK